MQTMTKGAPNGAPTLPACLMISGRAVDAAYGAARTRTLVDLRADVCHRIWPTARRFGGRPYFKGLMHVDALGHDVEVWAGHDHETVTGHKIEIGKDLAGILAGRA